MNSESTQLRDDLIGVLVNVMGLSTEEAEAFVAEYIRENQEGESRNDASD